MAACPLTSGHTWVEDPEGNANTHDGRTVRRDLRARSDPAIKVIAKRPRPDCPVEIYSVGMERVAYVLASSLGLPVPQTYLEKYDGEHYSIQNRIPECRSWIQAGAAPMMKTDIKNQDVYAKAALFDVWLANTDRRDVNLAFEPMPPGSSPGRARACRLWLIDHGQCGLWPAGKLADGRQPNDIPTSAAGVDGTLWDRSEALIGALMPPEYRMALKNTLGEARTNLLDAVRSVEDDAVRQAVMEVPDAYMSGGQRDATVSFLIGRLGKLDTVLEEYW